ncbi:calcium/proton exchanger [Deinococcus pimensis]|uniref:calcium/proton exchanger n=1 Tax=Deinococcus pimensis TaxID=309888 RepID=UPI0004ACF195|nr:calcium/proton exchanger [Deinococcus pimensis]
MLMNLLLVFVPLSLVLEYVVRAPPLWVFVTAVIGIVPLADWMRKGTEGIAGVAGPTIGGLLSVTFGNLAELILAIFVLIAGNTAVVKAQITGSIIGNALLGLGLAVLAGSFGRARQTFNKQGAQQLASMLVLLVLALVLPAIYDYTERTGAFRAPDAGVLANLDEYLSLGVAVVLILVYLLNLVYTLVTHRDVFSLEDDAESHGPAWPLSRSVLVLVAATVLVAVEAELVSGALEATSRALGLSPFFLGIVVLAIVGNFAEYVGATYFARRGRIGLAVSIAVGGTIQVALLTAPLLVIVSYFIGHPMNLVFGSPLELFAIIAVPLIVNSITRDGETTWFEGVLLITVYVLLALAFFFATPSAEGEASIPAPAAHASLRQTLTTLPGG